MKNTETFLLSGIVEMYVLGMVTEAERAEVETMAAMHAEVRRSINEFGKNLERFAQAHAVEPPPAVKPFILATMDLMARMQKGEILGSPPLLDAGTKASDFDEWLDRPDMVVPDDFERVFAKIIGYTPTLTTAIVWIDGMAFEEIHRNELEKFLILEGYCTISIEEDQHQLGPGDFMAIPLFRNHVVSVAPGVLCKVILQREKV